MPGPFVIRRYEANNGEIHNMKQQPESDTLIVNALPHLIVPGPTTSDIFVKVSKGAKEIGIAPRKIRFRFTPGSEPDGYATCGVLTIAVQAKSQYDAAKVGDPGTYLGVAGTVVGKIPENVYPVA